MRGPKNDVRREETVIELAVGHFIPAGASRRHKFAEGHIVRVILGVVPDSAGLFREPEEEGIESEEETVITLGNKKN